MNVLLYSHAFHPSIGGVETVSIQLAEGFVRRGIACKVVTRTPQDPDEVFDFPVIDNPSSTRIRQLVRWADVVLFNGASLAMQPWVLLYRKPFVWVHVGYQTTCIDGAGWFDGAPAPRTPWASIRHHARHLGVRNVLREAVKLAVRRFVAKHLVARNVAITCWMEEANPLPRQVQIYNPFPTRMFATTAANDPEYEFIFLGRLVSEKGVDTLLKAFAKIASLRPGNPPRLLIVGDGEQRTVLEALAISLGIGNHVSFVGSHRGASLARQVSRGRIAVVPSAWAEPMGGVVVELMAAGRNIIVSERGGLAECVGDAGFTFPNRNVDALALRMVELMTLPRIQAEQAARARERAHDFAPEVFIDQYVSMLREVSRKAGSPVQPVVVVHRADARATHALDSSIRSNTSSTVQPAGFWGSCENEEAFVMPGRKKRH